MYDAPGNITRTASNCQVASGKNLAEASHRNDISASGLYFSRRNVGIALGWMSDTAEQEASSILPE